MTNKQKAKRLEEMAVSQDRLSVVLFPADSRKALTDAALLRECAAMMRERGKLQWVRVAGSATRQMALYRGWLLEVGEGDQEWNWLAESGKGGDGDEASTLQAARSAAAAWVDEQERKP